MSSQFQADFDKRVAAPRLVSAGSVILGSYGVPALLLWESTIFPERDASERLMEVSEIDGKIYITESVYTKQSDIVL